MSYTHLDQAQESSVLENDDCASSVQSFTVLVVDDHMLVLSAISQILTTRSEIKQVITTRSYAEAEAQAAKMPPDVIWLDMHIAHGNGITEICRLRKLSPSSHIMALADSEDEQEAFAAIMMGAQGYCSKQDVDPGEIALMVCMLCRGEFVLRPALMTYLMQRLRTAAMPLWDSENGSNHHHRPLLRTADLNGLAQLTAREREILQLISQGYRDRDIAQGLHIAEKTVQKHVQGILSKLGAQNRTEAAYFVHEDRAHVSI